MWSNRWNRPEVIVRQAKESLMQWKMAQRSQVKNANGSRNREVVKWVKPSQGTLKCNVDASVFQEDGYCSFGFLIRDANGVCVKAVKGAIRGVFDPSLA